MIVRSWGKIWHCELPHSMDNRCPVCNDGTLGMTSSNFIAKCREHIVGFDAGNLAAIFECPRCGELFWFHLNPAIVVCFFKDFEPRG